MAFERDQGTCCMVLPLKLGVGLISMLTFAQSLVCIVALLTGDIRFQGNGYNQTTYRLPSILGAFGIIFGFVGLLGVYDDKFSWVRAFNRFLVAKLVAMVVTMMADYWTLHKCDSWLESEEHLKAERYGHMGISFDAGNAALDKLAELHVCPWARWAYLIGFAVDFTVCFYFTFKCLLYEQQLRQWTPYGIDFGLERHGVAGRWAFYGVKDPRIDERHPSHPTQQMATIKEEPDKAKMMYGSLDNVKHSYQDAQSYGPDGMVSDTESGPVGAAVAAAGGGLGGGLPAAARGAAPHTMDTGTAVFRPAAASLPGSATMLAPPMQPSPPV